MEPFLKAVGGKRWLSTKLAAEIMAIDPVLYVEPFVGGGAVALTLAPRIPKRVFDQNPAFIAVWRALRRYTPEEVLTAINRVERLYPNTGFGYVLAKEALNMHLAALDLEGERVLEFAALTLYVNARGFNGLWRVNARGQFNVPWGKYQTPRRFTLAELTCYHHVLQSIAENRSDFRPAFKALVAETPRELRSRIAVYVDPPYDSIPDAAGKRTAFTGYTAEGFDEIDQRDLAQWCRYLADLGIRVWASNADTPLIRELYAWGRIEAISENHLVGAKGDRRGQRRCLLIRSR